CQAARDRDAAEDGGTVMSASTAGIPRTLSRTEAAVYDPLAGLTLIDIQEHTRWSLSASTILHAMLLTWLIVLWRPAPDVPPITEIQFLEPSDLAGPPLAKSGPTAAEASAPGELKTGEQDIQFKRGAQPSELKLDAQSHNTIEDRLNARLASLQGTNVEPS